MQSKVKSKGHYKLFKSYRCPIEAWSGLFQATYPRNDLVKENIEIYLSDDWRRR